MVILNIINLASSLYSPEYFYTGLDCDWATILEYDFGYEDIRNIII